MFSAFKNRHKQIEDAVNAAQGVGTKKKKVVKKKATSAPTSNAPKRDK